MHSQHTIAAIATPAGAGALAIIRMSGPSAQAVLFSCTGRKLKPRHATLLSVLEADGSPLDECIATLFSAPASFTGEDVVEIVCHGGMLVTRRVLERLLASGAQPAEPGEFSRRAFENGRMDLTQAEAIMDIIQAGSDLALRAAHSQLRGGISAPVIQVIDSLIDTAAHIEAYIDFPEEDIAPHSRQTLCSAMDTSLATLRKLMSTAEAGRLLREGVRTAIIGAPNAGKSSLLNCLLGFDRAIVSPTAGTTRDTVEEAVTLGGLLLRLIDTAGMHDSSDSVEQCGIERAMHARDTADLILEVADASLPPRPLPPAPKNTPNILVLNKCDLQEHPAWQDAQAIRISCRTGEGLTALQQAIADTFAGQNGEQYSAAAINTRHRYALQQAIDCISAAKTALEHDHAPELISIDLRAALEALGSITGKVDTEDILTRVFSTFCLGK